MLKDDRFAPVPEQKDIEKTLSVLKENITNSILGFDAKNKPVYNDVEEKLLSFQGSVDFAIDNFFKYPKAIGKSTRDKIKADFESLQVSVDVALNEIQGREHKRYTLANIKEVESGSRKLYVEMSNYLYLLLEINIH